MRERRVLVLEDDEAVRELWVECLEQAGYTSVGLAAGAEALARLPDLNPDVILLDMLMPGMDGFEFLARLRANAHTVHIPLLIVSALGDALFIDAQGRAVLGVASILTKPVSLGRLIEHVARIIGPHATSGSRLRATAVPREAGAS